MADTRMQLEVEDWGRRNWMPMHFGTRFSRERLPLRSGGVFDFDAVSEDRSIVATISTSGAKTSGGKHAVGKILKLRSDMLFLTLVEATRRLIVLTERDMREQCEKEALGGRVPREIEFVCALIPDELRHRLVAARLKASGEWSGGRSITLAKKDLPTADIEKARRLFHEAGLAFPTIPHQLSLALKERDNWLFSTHAAKACFRRRLNDRGFGLLRKPLVRSRSVPARKRRQESR